MSAGTTRYRSNWGIPALVFLVSAALYAVLGSRQQVPLTTPDEYLFGHLARSVAAGDGLSWYGGEYRHPAVLFIAFLAPNWMLSSGESAYQLAKVAGAIAACTAVFPLWRIARPMMSTNLRTVVPVVLSVAGTWMLSTAGLMSEN